MQPILTNSSNKTEQASVNILDVLYSALAPHGLRPKELGKFARVQAFWRGSRDYNVSVNLKNGVWTDFVTGETQIPFTDLLKEMGIDPDTLPTVKGQAGSGGIELGGLQRKRSARSMWEKGSPLNEYSKTHVAIARKYLENRGIPLSGIEKLLPKMRAMKSGDDGATLLLPIYSPLAGHDWIGVQRISLDKNGNKVGEDAKKMLGSHFVAGGSSGGFLLAGDETRFTKKILGICEGPETGLAIRAATGMPVYIMYDSGGLARVSLEFLSELGVEEVLIASDNDDPIPKLNNIQPGQKAAFELAERISKEDTHPARISIPPREYGGPKNSDWLDVLVKNPAGMATLLFSSVEYIPENKRTSNGSNVKINGVFKIKF